MHFYKYQGTGNDFILIDNRQPVFDRENFSLIKKLCDRRFGIGADGLLLLSSSSHYNFDMTYYNADGNLGSMCGNGGRCITAFAKKLGLINTDAVFSAFDGVHESRILKMENDSGIVSLKMNDVNSVERNDDFIFLDTGSPHYITYRKNIDTLDIIEEGRKIRYNDRFKLNGVNVNFVERNGDSLYVRTYERGVEDETLSCGTGVTASALATKIKGMAEGKNSIAIRTKGGDLMVKFTFDGNKFTHVWLEGPVSLVYEGTVVV